MAKRKPVKKKIIEQKIKKPLKRWHPTPLKGSFMVLAIVGFLVTAYIVYPISFNFGVAFMVLFGVMFLASLISMGQAPEIEK